MKHAHLLWTAIVMFLLSPITEGTFLETLFGINRPSSSHSSSHQQTYKPRATPYEVLGYKQMDFAYPTPQDRQAAIQSGVFDPTKVIPIGVAADSQRIFITMPQWFTSGTPATLATVPFPTSSTSPPLQPYPNWDWHRPGNCDGLTSVFRVKIDECRRLWVLDSGMINRFVSLQRACQPQVVVFNLDNDQLIYRYRFPNAVLEQESLLVSIEVEYPDAPCGGSAGVLGAVIYAADAYRNALIVADLRLPGPSNAWRVADKTMYPSPEAGTFTINGESFELMDGVLGLALSPRSTHQERILFYYALSSFQQRWVPTRILRNSTAAVRSPKMFYTARKSRYTQAAGCSMDQNGVLFFGLMGSNALACWNIHKSFSPKHIGIIAQDHVKLQFISTVTVDPYGRIWLISMRFQKIANGSLDPNDVNYRVLMLPSSTNAVHGTVCDMFSHFHD